MKIFKRIYFPIMAALILVTIIFGFLSAYGVGSTSPEGREFRDRVMVHATAISEFDSRNSLTAEGSIELTATANYVFSQLNALEATVEIEMPPEFTDHLQIEVPATSASLLRVNSLSTSSDTHNAATYRENRTVFLRDRDFSTDNVVLFVPGTRTLASLDADTAVFSVRLDAIGPEASSAAVIGSLLEVAKNYARATNPSHINDLVFVFADGGLELDIGLRTILNQLELIRPNGTNALNDVGFVATFDARGTGGSMVLVDAGHMPQPTLRAAGGLGGINTNSFISNFNLAFENTDEVNRPAGEIPSLAFATIGNLRNERTINDNADSLSRNTVNSIISATSRTVSAFAYEDLSALGLRSATESVYFSYFNFGTVAMPFFISYILGGIIIGLLIAIIIINVKKRKAKTGYSFLKISLGGVIQIVAVVAAAAAVFILFSLMALLLAGFGVISIQAFTLFSLSNPGIIISALILFAIIMVAVYVPLKKAFFITAPNIVRGSVFITSILALIMSFVAPSISLIFSLLAICQLSVMLISLIFKDKYKKRFNDNIEKLFLYAWPSIIFMPLFITTIVLTAALTPLILLVAIVSIFSLITSSLLPYADMIKKYLQKVAQKLPEHNVRLSEEVTEMVAEGKSGKMVEKTYTRKYQEKWRWNYSHAFGIGILTFLAFLSFMLFSSFGGGFNSMINSFSADSRNFYTVGSVQVRDAGGSTALVVSDLSAHRQIANYLPGLEWNSLAQHFSMPAISHDSLTIIQPELSVDSEEGEIRYTSAIIGRSRLRVTLTNTTAVTEIRINRSNISWDVIDGQIADTSDADTFVFVNNGAPQIELFLPYASSSFLSIRLEATGNPNIAVTIEESVDNPTSLLQHNPQLRDLFAEESSIRNLVSANLIFTRSASIVL